MVLRPYFLLKASRRFLHLCYHVSRALQTQTHGPHFFCFLSVCLSSGRFQFITPVFDIHYFSRIVWGWPNHGVGGAKRRRRKRGRRRERLWMGLQCLTSSYFLSFPLRLVSACAVLVCVCVCVPGRGVMLQFPPAGETGDAALGPWLSHSEAFRARRGSYLKQRGFPSALSCFPEMGQSGEISQFRDVLTFCNDFLLCFIERWERID